MRWDRVGLAVKWLLLGALLIFFLGPEWPAFADPEYRLRTIVRQRHFDFLRWELGAMGAKAQAILSQDHAYLGELEQKHLVLEYLEHVAEAQRLNNEIRVIYTDPDVADPDAEARALQAELEQKQATIAALRPLAEAIIQAQVGAVLAEESFALLGQPWPPVMMHMTPLPSLLVVSRRDRVEQTQQVSLQHGLSAAEHEEMETAVYEQLDRSALVVPIGGMGTYPAMIMETSSLNWLIEVTAHEWSHHWLTLQPVGLRYGSDPQMRVINETIASIVDQEIARAVLLRYYPEFLPPEAEPEAEAAAPDPGEPPAFDFRAEMAETRRQVDRLLAEGEVKAAEMYMEARRRVFVEHGYPIRKLNQAYFAFYGAYAAAPGATGEDPTGPMLRRLRAQTPSLHAFLQTVAPITSFADLERIHDRIAPMETGGEATGP